MEVERNQDDGMGLPAPCASPPASTPTPPVTIAKYRPSCGPQDSPVSIIPPMKRRLITLSTAGNLKISPLAPQQLQQRRPHPLRRSEDGGPMSAPDVINLTHEAPTHDAQAVGPGTFSNAAALPAYGPPLDGPQETQRPVEISVQQTPLVAVRSPDQETQVELDALPSKQDVAPRRLLVLPMRPLQGGLLFPPSVADAIATTTAAAASQSASLSAAAWAEDNNPAPTHEPPKKPLTSPPPLQQHSLRTRTLLAVAAAAAAVAAHEEGAAEGHTTAELRDAALRNLRPAATGPSTPERDYDLQEARRDEELQQLQQLQQAHQQPCSNRDGFVEDWPQDPQRPSLFAGRANEAALGHAGWDPQEVVCGVEGAVGGGGVEDLGIGQAEDGQDAAGEETEMSRLTLGITIAVRASSNRGRRQMAEGGARAVCRKGYVKGPVCGVFDLVRYLGGRDCVLYQGRWISRSKFEKVGGSTMAKWYRSIRALPSLEPLGEWLERHNLPVFRGPNRRSRKRSAEDSGDELGGPWQWEWPATGHEVSHASAASLPDGGGLSPAGLTAAAGAWGNQMPMLPENGGVGAVAVAESGSDDSLPTGMLSIWPLQLTAVARPPVAGGSPDAAQPYGLYEKAAGTGVCLQSEARPAGMEGAPTDAAGPAQRKRRLSASESPALEVAVIGQPQEFQPQPHPLQLQSRPASQPTLVGFAPLQQQNPEEEEGYVNPSHPADAHHQPAGAGPTPGPQRHRLSSTVADGAAAAAWAQPHVQVVEVSDDDDDDDDVIVVEDIGADVREHKNGGGRAASVAAMELSGRHKDLPEPTCLWPQLPAKEALRHIGAEGELGLGTGGSHDAHANAEKQRQEQEQQQQQQQAVLQPIQQPQQLQEQHGGQHGCAPRRPRLLLRKAVSAGYMSVDGTPAHTQPYFFTVSAPPDMLYCPPSNTCPVVVAAVAPDGVEAASPLSELEHGDGSRCAATETATASGAVRRVPQPHVQRRQALSAISCENLTRGALLAAHSLQALQQHSEQPAAYSAPGGHAVWPSGWDVLQRRNAGPLDSVSADLDANRAGWGGPKSLGRTALNGAAQAAHRPGLQAPKQQLSRQPGSWRAP